MILIGVDIVLVDDLMLIVCLVDIEVMLLLWVVFDLCLCLFECSCVCEGGVLMLYLYVVVVSVLDVVDVEFVSVLSVDGWLDLGVVLVLLVEWGINEVYIEVGVILVGVLLCVGWVDELLLY